MPPMCPSLVKYVTMHRAPFCAALPPGTCAEELDHIAISMCPLGQTRQCKTKFTRRLKDKILHHPSPLYTPSLNIEDARGLPKKVLLQRSPSPTSANIKMVVGRGGGSSGARFCPSAVLVLGCCILPNGLR